MAVPRVLIVDDEPLVVVAVTKTLARHGYDTLSANGAPQAFEIIRNHSPIDVVLSDVTMPEMCGLDLVQEIARSSPGTACVLMTGSMVGTLSLPPGVPLLRKPISTRDLIEAIERVRPKSLEDQAKLRDAIEQSAQLRLEAQEIKHELREARERSHDNIRKSCSMIAKRQGEG
jgi:YesN/AraC family two-component response regulator